MASLLRNEMAGKCHAGLLIVQGTHTEYWHYCADAMYQQITCFKISDHNKW